jgi:hypothetical protein
MRQVGRDEKCILFYVKPERKTPFGRRRCRQRNNTKMDHKEMGWDSVA